MQNILELHGVTKRFGGVAALSEISFGVPRGSVTAVIGPNGAGKTTLLAVLSGLLPMDAGRVVSTSATFSRTFQAVRLFLQLSVLDNLLVVLTERSAWSALLRRHTRAHELRAMEILERLALASKRHELAGNLSYGQRKLLEIGRAIATRPSLLFLDEPFAGLSVTMAEVVSAVIRELRTQDVTVVLIEHDMQVVRDLADHIVVLDGGTLLMSGKPQEVLHDRRVQEAYLGI